MSTLMLKRIGSTMLAGESTAKKMLAWTLEGKERLKDLYDDVFVDTVIDSLGRQQQRLSGTVQGKGRYVLPPPSTARDFMRQWTFTTKSPPKSAGGWNPPFVPLLWRKSQTRRKSTGNADYDSPGDRHFSCKQ
ncbi:MAG: hypothetical protein PHD36_01265 [Desulfotomaculaceae bacterium]|nr:hypothetical protein [Desulfotomaculaceae bacterium]